MRWPWRAAAAADETRWVVLDVESSGLDPQRDRLLAIAAVALHVHDGAARIALHDSFELLLQQTADAAVPDKPNILVHGLGVAAQRDGTPPAQALQAFNTWAGSAPRLGFHVGFDRALLDRACARHLGQAAPAQWLDIEALAAVSHPAVKAHALDDWLAHFEIPCAARHQAAADSLASAELLLRLWPALRRMGVRSFKDCARVAAGRRWLVG
jgi:DNA polymerase III subunit epsilon